MTNEIDEQGLYVQAKDVIVEFVLEEILDLSLNGFSCQNVLSELAIEPVEKGFRLSLKDSYGIGGTIDARLISIRLKPGKPEALR